MENKEKRFKDSHCEKIVKICPDNQITIHKLNDDCLTYIFMFLQIVDKVKIESVCKRWRDVGKKSWQNIKTLDESVEIWGFKIYTIPPWELINILKNTLQRCGLFLRRLDLSSMHTSNSILHCVGKFCPNLQFIDVGPAKMTLPSIKVWTKNCHNLTEITFGKSTKACNDTQLSKFFLQNKQLQSLKIVCNYFLTGECFLSLPVHMAVIVIQDCPNISFNHLPNALEKFIQLKTFSLIDSGNTRFHQSIHSMSTTLKILEIPRCSIFNIDCIIQMNDLEKLVISSVQLVTDAFLVTLAAKCKRLCHLNINYCYKVTNVGLQAIARLPKIEYLSIQGLHNITDSALTYIPNLKKLFCMRCHNIEDDGICTLIETCDSIEILDLSYCSKISNTLAKCAINVTKNRTNSLILNLNLLGTSVYRNRLYNTSPLLKMTLPSDGSECSFQYFSDDYYESCSDTDERFWVVNDFVEDEVGSDNYDFSEQEDEEDEDIAYAN